MDLKPDSKPIRLKFLLSNRRKMKTSYRAHPRDRIAIISSIAVSTLDLAQRAFSRDHPLISNRILAFQSRYLEMVQRCKTVTLDSGSERIGADPLFWELLRRAQVSVIDCVWPSKSSVIIVRIELRA